MSENKKKYSEAVMLNGDDYDGDDDSNEKILAI